MERQDEILIESTAKEEWKDEGKFSLSHDTEMKTLNVTIKQLKPEDKGVYKCQFKKPNRRKVEVDVTVGKKYGIPPSISFVRPQYINIFSIKKITKISLTISIS